MCDIQSVKKCFFLLLLIFGPEIVNAMHLLPRTTNNLNIIKYSKHIDISIM